MVKKVKLFLIFIILNAIFFYIYSVMYPKYNYKTILFQIDTNEKDINNIEHIENYGIDIITTKMRHIAGLINANEKISYFSVFKDIPKWHIQDNIFLYEIVSNNSKKNIENLINRKFDLQKRYVIYQYFSLSFLNNNKNFDILEKELISFLNLNKQRCDDEIKKLNKLKEVRKSLFEKNKIETHDDLFGAFLLANKKTIYYDLLNASLYATQNLCSIITYEIFQTKKIQKFNLFFLSIVTSLIISLMIYFIITLFNEFKKK